MDEKLRYLERDVAEFLDRTLGRLPGARFASSAIAGHLIQEVANATKRLDKGEIYAPDQFTLSMHPADVEELLAALPRFQSDLEGQIKSGLSRLGFQLVRDPHVTLATDPTVSRWEVRVFAWRSSTPQQPGLTAGAPPRTSEIEAPPPGAFLIVEGKRHFPLTRPLIKIGRRHDNDLILSDPHVSRNHAELRLMAGHYVVVDLASTAGTYVNGRLVKQHILDPGDVISIALVQLIYGEDPGGPPGVTPPYSPPSATKAERDQITPHYLRTLSDQPKPKAE